MTTKMTTIIQEVIKNHRFKWTTLTGDGGWIYLLFIECGAWLRGLAGLG
jgi:hypothetical protein